MIIIDPSNVISASNISVVWAKAFLTLMKPGAKEVSPLMVVVDFQGGHISETPKIRKTIDSYLANENEFSCHTVANTIFPESLWNPSRSRKQLFHRYMGILWRLKKIPQNRNGLYFERMVAFGEEKKNQLEHVIRTWKKGNHRRSALQVSIFDPLHDHTHQRQRGFPCLQHVFFVPHASNLTVTGVYATQSIDIKAYGNYLGLCMLGHFMAHELELQLTRMICIANVAKLETSKEHLKHLTSEIKKCVRE